MAQSVSRSALHCHSRRENPAAYASHHRHGRSYGKVIFEMGHTLSSGQMRVVIAGADVNLNRKF